MTDYSITLPQSNDVQKPKLLNNDKANISGDMNIALSAFDVDGKEGLSSDELLQAFDYFVNKEKEIAVTGKKGDGVITSKDIEQIIKSDSKFSAIREKLKDDNKVVDLLSNVVMTLSSLVQVHKFKEIDTVDKISEYGMKCIGTDYGFYRLISEYTTTNTQSKIKEVDGKKVQICWNNRGEKYVKTADGKHIYTDSAYVAKCLGYESESTWLGLGANKYYETKYQDVFVQVGNGGHHASDEYKLYKDWNEKTHTFTDGKCKSTGRRLHHLGGCR